MKEKKKIVVNHLWSIPCRGFSVDQRTNNLSIFNIIEQVQLPGEKINEQNPVFIPLELITMWEVLEKNDGPIADVEVSVFHPKGLKTKLLDYKIEAPMGIRRMRSISQIKIKVDAPGSYTFLINVKGSKEKSYTKVAETSLEINFK